MPRLLALALMVPLLTVYADLMGILGGAVVSAGMLDISSGAYFERARAALSLTAARRGCSRAPSTGARGALRLPTRHAERP